MFRSGPAGSYQEAQLVISSNYQQMHEWAKSRLKRIDFDVHFAQSEKNSAQLAELFRERNPVFGWFASLYLEQLDRLDEPHDDELVLARDVMTALYQRAGRERPAYFPARPLEQLYDPGRMRWRDLLEGTKQAARRRERNRVLIEFAEDLQHHEIRRYVALLPQTIKAEVRGKSLIIENPADFERWIDGERGDRKGLVARVMAAWGR